MSTALAPAVEASTQTVTADQLALIQRTVAAGATPDELQLYLYDCARQGVHPLDRLLHFTKRNGKYTPVTSIDLMRIRAAETGEYVGNADPVFVEGPNGFPVSATATVYRLVQGQRCAFTATARMAEYRPDPPSDHVWKRRPFGMLGKCSEALALRKGFPRQLSGLYAAEELEHVPEGPPPPYHDAVTEQDPGPAEMAPPPPASEHVAPRSYVPSGAVLITKVDPPWPGASGNAKAFVFHSGMPAGTTAGLPVYTNTLKTLAEECLAGRVPVHLEIVTSSTGKPYIRRIVKVEAIEAAGGDRPFDVPGIDGIG